MILRKARAARTRPGNQGLIPRAVLMLVAAVLLGWLAPTAARADDPSVISSVRVGVHQGITRFVLHISEPIRYRAFTLSNPYRVVIDMPRVDWRLAEQAELGAQNVIDAFRFGNFTETTTRLVLDVNRPVQVHRIFALEPRGHTRTWRLVIDLKTISEDEFQRLARLERQERSRRNATHEGDDPPVRRERRTNERPLIVLDPGHGGVDPGAMSRNGTREKDIVLKVAEAMAAALEETGRFRALLTRDSDVYLPLRERYNVARRANADLFISIHADSNPVRGTRGLSVYTLSERASDSEAAALARRENRSDVIAGVDLRDRSDQVANILIDLVQRETMNQSARFAEMLVTEMRGTTRVLRRTHRFAGFAVLKAPDVPSVLVELGYLTNPEDEQLLRSEAHHRRLAEAMTEAVSAYFTYLAQVGSGSQTTNN